MQGYEIPRILKLPEGECRQTPRRLPIDVGDVLMNIRMDPNKTRFVNESISKYAQGINPYGEFGYPYKINKNNIRPPIIDPKFYQPLSRMPVKFDAVTAGPIVRGLYEKQVQINSENPYPEAIIDRIDPEATTNLSAMENLTDGSYREGNIEHHIRTTPNISIPYWPSIPVHQNTGVPEIELDPKIFIRPNMGIHAPYQISDPSRDVLNMRTPMHVAFKPGYKDPYTYVTISPEQVTGINESAVYTAAQTNAQGLFTEEPVINYPTSEDLAPALNIAFNPNLAAPTPVIGVADRQGPDLAPKIQSSAWFNPSYMAWQPSVGWHIGHPEQSCVADKINTSASARANYKLITPVQGGVDIRTRDASNVAGQTNVSWIQQQGKMGQVKPNETLDLGSFGARHGVPSIQKHPEFNGRPNTKLEAGGREYFFIANEPSRPVEEPIVVPRGYDRIGKLRTRLDVQNRDNVENTFSGYSKNVPIDTSGYIKYGRSD